MKDNELCSRGVGSSQKLGGKYLEIDLFWFIFIVYKTDRTLLGTFIDLPFLSCSFIEFQNHIPPYPFIRNKSLLPPY